MKKRLLVGFAAMVIALVMAVSPAFASVVEYDNAGTVNWGKMAVELRMNFSYS